MAETRAGEQPQYGDDTWSRLKQAVARDGPHVCEINRCPRCGSFEFDVHPFAESLLCSECGQRYPSESRRACAVHEALIDKMREAVQQVRDWYPAELFGGAEEPDTDDLSKLDPETRALIQRKCVRMARTVCANILAEFERLLALEIELELDDPETPEAEPEDVEEESDGDAASG